jgi:lipoprotein-releasing system permease protein
MFHPLSLFIGLRYARARAHRYFVSFITWVSLAGVSVGVAALIVILSVMNGFESELRDRLLALSAPLRVTSPLEASPDWNALREEIRATLPGAKVERYAQLQVLAVRQPESLGLMLRGADEFTQSELAGFMVQGSLQAMAAEEGIVLGALVAEQLAVSSGDTVKMLVPVVTGGDVPGSERLDPKMREFLVAGVVEAGIQDHDGQVAYVNMDVMSGLGAARSRAEGLNIRIDDAMAAPAAAAQLRAQLAANWPTIKVTDWTEDHASYFRAIRIEKTMMALILMLIVAVAAFNIVAMLVMVVTDKRTDIAILRTFGASPRTVAGAFVAQGLMIGWLGVAAGVLLGVAVAANVGPILDLLYQVAGVSLFDPEVYYISEVPSELQATDVLLVAGSALLLTVLATIYPALRAAATSPAEALRYE